MRVPLLDLGEQHRTLAALIREQVDDVLRTNRFILGPKVEEFEDAICRYTGAQFAVGVSSGTDALLAILMALGIGGGDAVVTTPYSFFATAGCIARVVATPSFSILMRRLSILPLARLGSFCNPNSRALRSLPCSEATKSRELCR